MTFGGPPDEVHRDKRISAAVSLAKKSIANPHENNDKDFDNIGLLFNIEEL